VRHDAPARRSDMPSSSAARRSLRVSAKRSTPKLATRPGQKSVAMRGEGRARSWPERHPTGHELALVARLSAGAHTTARPASGAVHVYPQSLGRRQKMRWSFRFCPVRIRAPAPCPWDQEGLVWLTCRNGSCRELVVPVSPRRLAANLTVRFEFAVHVIYGPK